MAEVLVAENIWGSAYEALASRRAVVRLDDGTLDPQQLREARALVVRQPHPSLA